MRYVHWIKINGYTDCKETANQFREIESYLKSYEGANAMLYQYDSGSFNWVVRLECGQCYKDLDLDVNSFSTKLQRLNSKPKNIGRERIFRFPECYRKYL